PARALRTRARRKVRGGRPHAGLGYRHVSILPDRRPSLGKGVPLAEIGDLPAAVNLPRYRLKSQSALECRAGAKTLLLARKLTLCLELHAQAQTCGIHRNPEITNVRELYEFPFGAEKHAWHEGDVDTQTSRIA